MRVAFEAHRGLSDEFGNLESLADELGAHRKEAGDDTRHVRRGHACSSILNVVERLSSRTRGCLNAALPSCSGDDAYAGCENVGFGTAVTGGTFRAEIGDSVLMRFFSIGRPNRNGQISISRIVHAHQLAGLRRANGAGAGIYHRGDVASIAGGHDNHDTL